MTMNNKDTVEVPEWIWIDPEDELQYFFTDDRIEGLVKYARVDPPAAPRRVSEMADKLTLTEEEAVAGTPVNPAVCTHCCGYAKVFNKCTQCGKDERPRFGCEHRIGQGGICNECRSTEQAQEIADNLAGNPEKVTACAKEILWLLHRFARLNRSDKNRPEFLTLQVEASELLEKVEFRLPQEVAL